jgi:amino acid adenylation domain-containing protein
MYVDSDDIANGFVVGVDVSRKDVGNTGENPSYISESQKRQLAQWNATQYNYHLDLCVPQLVELQAATNPDAVALIMGQQTITYHHLNQRANQLAHYLRRHGVSRDVLVGICVERSLDMVVGLLAILKSGAAYVALDPSHPSERLIYMLQDARVSVLVTQQHVSAALPAHDAHVVCLDNDSSLAHERSDNPGVNVHADDTAYVIYTSGSTGKPKGVQVAHSSLLNLLFWHQQLFSITAADRATQFASPAFDVTVEEIWPYLTLGASVYFVPDENIRIIPTAMRDWLLENDITISMMPTALVENLMTLDWPATTPLRYVLTGGDTLYRYPPTTLPFALINNYGPTEATVVATCQHVLPDVDATTPPSIGRPIANTQVYLLDENLRQVPIGEVGELYIGGAGLAKGYLNHPELTAEKFVPHPLSDDPSARLYKTGDLARFLPDGQIAFMGRADYQVKVRGYRIEPNEIMNVLNRQPAIQSSVVVAREVHPGSKLLVAYMTLESGAALAVNALREALLADLPEYMVPSYFVVLDRFPINANGKIQRDALPMPDATNTLRDEAITRPATLVQERLVDMVIELLGIEEIGVRDNFFYVGGHSLFAAQLVKRVEREFGKKVPLSTLFAGPTVAQLADALQPHSVSDERVSVLPIQTTGSRRPFYFLHGNWTGGAFYCFALASAFGPDQPFYVLEPYKFDGLRTIPTLEEVAAAHVTALRSSQPEGPYLLGGFCNGGLVAYEMARQLHDAGQQVETLQLVNPSFPDSVSNYRKISDFLSRTLHLSKNRQAVWFMRTRHALRHVYRFLQPGDRRLQDFDKLTDIEPRLKSMFPPVEALFRDYVAVFTWVTAVHDRQIFPGKITFYWASEEPFIRESWLSILQTKNANDIEEHTVPGTHMSCVTDHVQPFTQILSTCLLQVHQHEMLPTPVSVS